MVVVKKLYLEISGNTYDDYDNDHTYIWKRVKQVLNKADLNGDDMVDKCEFRTLLDKAVVASGNTWKL